MKLSYEEYKEKNFDYIFKNNIYRFLLLKGYDYNDFLSNLTMRMDINFTVDGVLELIILRENLEDNIENYVQEFGEKHAVVSYLVLKELAKLTEKTMVSVRSYYEKHCIEQDIKNWVRPTKGEM